MVHFGFITRSLKRSVMTGLLRRFESKYNQCELKKHPAWGVFLIHGAPDLVQFYQKTFNKSLIYLHC